MCYFDNATQRTQVTVDTICHELKNPKLGKIDLVVGIGFSGILLLTPIYMQSGIPFGAIRKNKKVTHSSRSIETGGIHAIRKNMRYVIIDDFTTSGDTLDKIKIEMSDHECVGIILYQEEKFNKGATLSDFPDIPLICLAQDINEIMTCIHTEKETCGV